METLLYVLGFVIGALGTSFLLYFLKTRKLLRTQHKLILDLGLALVGREITEGMKKERDDKRSCEKKPTEQNDKPTPCEEKNEAK
jgi:hypothetical protein